MAAHRIVLLALTLALVAVFAPTLALAQDLPTPDVPNSQYQFAAIVNAAAVQVRSGPGDNYYPTMRLDKGNSVMVVGIKFDWLKIVPPAGSFSVVAKQYVAKEEGGNTGRVTVDALNVRAGSSLSSLKYAPQCKLKKGDTVTIVGEQDEYYQIKPPADAFLYVHQRYVDPVRQLNKTEMLPTTLPAGGDNSVQASGNVGEAATQPSETVERPVAVAPTTQQTEAEKAEQATIEFDRLEALAKSSTTKSLDEQPLAELASGYDALLKGDSLPVSMRRMAELRLMSLRMKLKAQEELLATRKQQAESEKRLAALREERAAIEARLASGVEIYTAVGTLQASTVQSAGQPVYRLTDPATGRTLCYLKSSDPKHVSFIGQFVGVRGELTTDPQLALKMVLATEMASVDPAKVNHGVTAQMSPPSLIKPKVPTTASTGNN